MSRETPLVVYVGEEKRGNRLHQMTESLGWTVLTATEELQALGMYVFYMPDLMIIDSQGNAAGAEQVVFHLQSVNAQPILVIAEPTARLPSTSDAAMSIVPSSMEDSSIVLAASELLQGEPALC